VVETAVFNQKNILKMKMSKKKSPCKNPPCKKKKKLSAEEAELKRRRDTKIILKKGYGKGKTPGGSSHQSKKEYGPGDSRFRVKGGGGGVKRKAAEKLKSASKKQIRLSKKMNKAKGRKAPKRKY
jgi:hypothetical protein